MKKSLSTLLFFLASSAAAALPPIRPDQRLAPPVFVPTGYNVNVSDTAARVATDGRISLAVWADYADHIFAGRFDANGKLLDLASIPIDEGGFTFRIFAFFTGQSFVVIYNYRPPPHSYEHQQIRVRRISVDGKLLDERPRIVFTSRYRINGAAFNGSAIGILIEDGNLLTLTADGESEGPPRWNFGSDTNLYPVAIAAAGNTFVAVAVCDRGDPCIGVRKFGEGETKAFVPLNRSLTGGYPLPLSIATNGVNHLIIFAMANVNPPGSSILTVSLDASGGTPRLGEFKVLEASSGNWPWIVADGAGYEAMWTQGRDQYYLGCLVGQHINANDYPDGQRDVIACRTYGFYSIVAGGSGFVGLQNNGTLSAALMARNAAGDLTVKTEVAVARVPRKQTGAAIATNGTKTLIAWNETAAYPRHLVRAAMIDESGKIGPPIELSAESYPFSAPAVASNGSDFFVAWSFTEHVRGSRISADGRLLDAAPLAVDEGLATSAMYKNSDPNQFAKSRTIATQWDGSKYVVVSAIGTVAAASYVFADGSVKRPFPANVSGYGADIAQLALACAPPRCLLGGTRWGSYGSGVFAAPVPNTVLKSDNIFSNSIWDSDVVVMQRSDAAAVFFTDSNFYLRNILASRMAADGSAIDPVPVPVISAPLSEYRPAAMAVIDNMLYWRDETADEPRLMRSTFVLEPGAAGKLKMGATTQLDSLAPVAVAATSRNLYVVYESMYSLYLRTYAAPDPPPFTERRRAVR